MIKVYFVLNGLFNGEDGVFAQTTGFGKQQKDGWYWLVDGMDDGKGPFESREKALAAAKADPGVKRQMSFNNLRTVIIQTGGFHRKAESWSEVGRPIAANLLQQLQTYDAEDLGIDLKLATTFKFTPPELMFLVKLGLGYYLVNTEGANYARYIRYVGFDLPKTYCSMEPQGSIDHMPDRDEVETGE